MDEFRKEPFFRNNQNLLQAWTTSPLPHVTRAAKRWRVIHIQIALERLFPRLMSLYYALRRKVKGVQIGSPVLKHRLVTKHKEQ